MRINALKTKVSALIPDEQPQTVLLGGEPLERVEKSKCLSSIFTTNGHGTEEIASRIILARSVFSRPQSCLWSRLEISLRTKTVVLSILICDDEAWPVQVTDERMLAMAMTASAAFNTPPPSYMYTSAARAKKAPLV